VVYPTMSVKNDAPIDEQIETSSRGPIIQGEVNTPHLQVEELTSQSVNLDPTQLQQSEDQITDASLRKSGRKQSKTSKGLGFNLKNSITFMKSCHRRLTKQVDILLLLLNGSVVDSVTNDLDIVEKTYSEFTDLYARACALLSEDDSNQFAEEHKEINQLMDSTDEIYLSCKERVCNWLLLKEKENIVAKAPSDIPSSKSGSNSHSKSGSKSKSGSSKSKSSGSHKSNCSDRSIRQKAKVASLEAEAVALKKVREAELSLELSRLDVKIQKAKAMDKVYSSYADKETGAEKHNTLDAQEVKPKSETRKTHTEDYSAKLSPLPTHHELSPVDYVTTSQIQAAMIDMIKLQSAPKPDLDPFSGDPLEYLYFKANFQDVVETSVPD
jgi:hypothetical protein